MKAKIIHDFEYFKNLLSRDGFLDGDDYTVALIEFKFNWYKGKVLNVTPVEPMISPNGRKLPSRYSFITGNETFCIYPEMLEFLD